MAERVVVGISGGVDSAVAAYLLKKQGLEVIGITFKFTDTFDATDAIEVAKSLEIEHHIVDYRKETIDPPKKCFIARWFQKKQEVIEVNVVEKNPYIENKKSKFIEVIK